MLTLSTARACHPPVGGGWYDPSAMTEPDHVRGARARQQEIFGRMTPEQRIACGLAWTRFTLEIARAGVRYDHPDWTPEQIDREIGRRITGIDVTRLDWEKVHRQQAQLRARRNMEPADGDA